MIIKKFSSKTEAEAIDNARKELGPEVVVMNVRSVKKKGFLGFFSSFNCAFIVRRDVHRLSVHQ